MENNKRKEIGQRINAALAAADMKQKELASIIGVHDNAISYYTSGARTPNLTQVIGISQALHVSTDYLLGLTDVMTPETTVQAIAEYTGLKETAISALIQNTNTLKATTSHVHTFFENQLDFVNSFVSHILSNTFSEICGSITLLKLNVSEAKKLYEQTVDMDNLFSSSISAEQKKMLAKAYRTQIIEWFGSFLNEYFSDELTDLNEAESNHRNAVQCITDEMLAQEKKQIEEQ